MENLFHLLIVCWTITGVMCFYADPLLGKETRKQVIFQVIMCGPIIWVIAIAVIIYMGFRYFYDYLGHE